MHWSKLQACYVLLKKNKCQQRSHPVPVMLPMTSARRFAFLSMAKPPMSRTALSTAVTTSRISFRMLATFCAERSAEDEACLRKNVLFS